MKCPACTSVAKLKIKNLRICQAMLANANTVETRLTTINVQTIMSKRLNQNDISVGSYNFPKNVHRQSVALKLSETPNLHLH